MGFGSQDGAAAHEAGVGQVGDAVVALAPTVEVVAAIIFVKSLAVAVRNFVEFFSRQEIRGLDQFLQRVHRRIGAQTAAEHNDLGVVVDHFLKG